MHRKFNSRADLCRNDSSGITAVILSCALCVQLVAGQAIAQRPDLVSPWATQGKVAEPAARVAQNTPEGEAKRDRLIMEILEPEVELEIDPRRSKLVRTTQAVTRFSITDPEIVDVVQFSPTEFELIGDKTGQTTLTLWFADDGVNGSQILRYLVKVTPDMTPEIEYGELERRINEMFPDSSIQLIPIADKLLVRGQAESSEVATQILTIIRGEATDQSGQLLGPGSGRGSVSQGRAASVRPGADDFPSSQVISMLDVPGEMQVLLKVRIAELSRTALRRMGATFGVNTGEFTFASALGASGAFNAILDTDDVMLTLQALSSNAYSKILAEPNLVTLSGQPASFIAGGEFAVPTVVGVEGVAAATTQFRGFGTQLIFTPTVLDKDRFRLRVNPSFSSLNSDNSVNGIPGLNTRAVQTTVELREGQWLAIAGLIKDEQSGDKVRIPGIGNIPLLDMIFSRRENRREETELIVLVSPELIHPLEAECAPLILPGEEVTEPNDWEFFLKGRYEGNPEKDYRSTVWPVYQHRLLEAKHKAIREAKQQVKYQRSEQYYIHGKHGFSR